VSEYGEKRKACIRIPRHGTARHPTEPMSCTVCKCIVQCTHRPNSAHRRSANVIHSLTHRQAAQIIQTQDTPGRPSAVVVVEVVRLSPRKLLMARDRRVEWRTIEHTHTQAGRQAGSQEGGWGQVARPLHTPHGHHERGRVSSAQMHQQRDAVQRTDRADTHTHAHGESIITRHATPHHSIPLAPHTGTQTGITRTLDRRSMGG